MASETKQEYELKTGYGIRHDKSMWISLVDAKTGAHMQCDWELGEKWAKRVVTAVNFHERLVEALRDMSEELSFIHEAPEAIPGMIQACSVITCDGTRLLAESRTLLSEISKAAE